MAIEESHFIDALVFWRVVFTPDPEGILNHRVEPRRPEHASSIETPPRCRSLYKGLEIDSHCLLPALDRCCVDSGRQRIVFDDIKKRVSGVLQRGFDEFARDPDSKAISEIEFLKAAEWIWKASIASGRCTENELVAAADSLKEAITRAGEASGFVQSRQVLNAAPWGDALSSSF